MYKDTVILETNVEAFRLHTRSKYDFTFFVEIDQNGERHIWEMSHNANSPQGVCIYTGEPNDFDKDQYRKRIRMESLPIGTIRQILFLIEQYRGD